MVPEFIKTIIQSIINTSITSVQLLHGGDINYTARINTNSGDRFFLKWHPDPPSNMFEAEANGLRLLNAALTDLIIPEIILVQENFLLLEFIDRSNSGSSFDFGVQLAKLHRNTNEFFGLDSFNFIGSLPQQNRYYSKWKEFFIYQRIQPQIKLAIEAGKLNSKYHSVIDQLFNSTYVDFPDEPPALLHGDLWCGNYMFDQEGKATLYDPAIYYGHREMDLAMTRLFGGFTNDFYQGYNEEYPLKSGFEERFKLCNLYPILVHSNLFGGNYLVHAESILKRFF